MRLSLANQRKYPKSTHYIRTKLPSVVHIPVIAAAMKKTGQLDRAQFTAALSWNAPPTIEISVMMDCASFTPTPGNNVIRISKRIFVAHEAGRGYLATANGLVPALGVNILHEMVHWGDNLDGIDRPGEEGDEFEMLVYRANLSC